MEKIGKHKKRFGLIGKNISYSFSRGYFAEKFRKLGLADHSYENFDLAHIEEFKEVVQQNQLCGLNVTIPYKQEIIPYLDELDRTAEKIGAVNTIKFTESKLIGYNTDDFGFKESLIKKLRPHHQKALILGTGGASKAIAHILDELGIERVFVSRKPKAHQLSYDQLDVEIIATHHLIINCTPLGTHPNIDHKPALPYGELTEQHFLFDLIYNPPTTAFLRSGQEHGATTQNGLPMLQNQAEKAWQIWNS